MWRAIRWGMSGELIDLAARRSIPALERLEQVLDQVADTAADLGIAPVPAAAARADRSSQRMDELMEDGADPRELWPDVVERNQRSVGEWLSDREGAR